MLNRNISFSKSFLLLLLSFFAYFYGVKADLTDLPDCSGATASTSTDCKNSGVDLDNKATHCKDGNKIFVSTANSCTAFSGVSGKYYAFKCGDSCALLTGTSEAATVVYLYSSGFTAVTKTGDLKNGVNIFEESGTAGSPTINVVSALTGKDSTSGLVGHAIFKCVEGVCSKEKGYVLATKTNDSKVIYKYENSWADYNEPTCDGSNASDIGGVKINSNALELCKGSEFQSLANKEYILSATAKKYIGNDSTVTVLLVEDPDIVGYYLINDSNEIDGATPTQLVSCSGVTITCTATAAGSVPVGYYPKAEVINKLYKCTGSACAPTSSANNYYVDINNNLRKCNSDNCPKVTDASGYYIDANIAGNVIFCNASHKCTSEIGMKISKGYAYIDASVEVNDANKNFITCDGAGSACTKLDKTSDLDQNTKKVHFIDPSDPKKYVECVGAAGAAATCTTKQTSGLNNNVEFFADVFNSEFYITCLKNGGCFNSKGLQQCKSISNSGKCKDSSDSDIDNNKYCIYTDGNIYYSKEGKCTAVTSAGMYFFKNDNTKIDLGTDNNGYIYKCTGTSCSQYVDSSYLEPHILGDLPACTETGGTCTVTSSDSSLAIDSYCRVVASGKVYKGTGESGTCTDLTYLYSCTNGTCTKSSIPAAASYYFTGLPTLSTIRPYWIYDNLLYCTDISDPSKCSDVSYSTAFGYYIQGSDYIIVRRESDGTVKFGKLEAKPTEPCGPSNIGKLVLDGSDIAICLEDGKTDFKLSETANSKIIGYSSENIFGLSTGQKAIVTTVQNKSVTLDVDLPACTIAVDVCTVTIPNAHLTKDNYCRNVSNGKIYKGTAAEGGKCVEVFNSKKDEGLKVFNLSNVLTNSIVTDFSTTLLNPLLAIYDCAYDGCKRTYGYIQNDGKVYKSSEKGLLNVSSSSSEVTCADGDDIGKVKLNGSTLQVCVLDEVKITGNNVDDAATIETKATFVNVAAAKHFVMRPHPDDVTQPDEYFADKVYKNIALLKSEANVIALAQHSPQLQVCDDGDQCKIDNVVIPSGEYCIKGDGTTIYKMDVSCKKLYGDGGSDTIGGFKIFQKSTTFNKYVEVGSTLNSVTANTGELTPFFIMYDCSTTKCVQTSGFIKYGSGDNLGFVNCFTGNNIPANDGDLIPLTSQVGCIKLNKNESHDDLCDATEDGLKLAATGSYKFDGETFRMCTSVKTASNTYNVQFISIPIEGEGQFFFTNGNTPFPNTVTDGNVLIRYNFNYALLARNIPVGHYYNHGTIKTGADAGKDALITCANENKLSNCSIVNLSSGHENTKNYLDVTSNRVISCISTGCHLHRSSLKGYFLSSESDANTKQVISCTGASTNPCKKIADDDINDAEDKKEGVCSINTYPYICYDSTCGTDNTDRKKIESTGGSNAIYKTFTVKTANDFPGVSTANASVTLKITNHGSAILMEKDGLIECPDTIPSTGSCVHGSHDGQYCFHATSKKIYQTVVDGTTTQCSVVSVTGDAGQLLFFDSKNRAVEELSETRTDVVGYLCTATACELFKGYAMVASKVIHCNGWKDEGCIVDSIDSNACDTTDVGRLSSSGGNKLCFNDGNASRSVELPTTDNVKIIAFKANEANAVYGNSKNDLVFLSVASNRIQVISEPRQTSDCVYFNQLAVKANHETDVLIKCNSVQCSTINFFVAPREDEAGISVIDDGDSTKKSIIFKQSDTYVYSDITSKLEDGNIYYILETDRSKIIVCTKDEGCKAESGNTSQGHGYLDGSLMNYVITCSSSNGGSCTSTQGISENYYINGKETSKIIKIVSSPPSTTYEGSTTKGHAYVSKSGEKSIITCSSGTGCTLITLTDNDLNSEDKYFIYGDDIKYLILCNKNDGCAKENSATTYGTKKDGSNGERTIICSTNGCISSSAIASACGTIESSSYCKDIDGQTIDVNNYCFNTSNNKIFQSTNEALKCKEQTSDVFIIKNNSIYSPGELGKDSTGLIYECDATSCEQVISSFYLNNHYLYKCDDTGTCTIVNKIFVGYYLSGKPEVGEQLKYTKMIKCTGTLGSECNSIDEISPSDNGLYVDAGTLGNIIECISGKCHSEKAKTDHGMAYIDKSDNDTKSIISCDQEKCTSLKTALTGTDKLYFINGKATSEIITCTSSNCSSGDPSASPDNLYLDGTDVNYTLTCSAGCQSKAECRVNTGVNCEAGKYYNVKNSAAYQATFILETLADTTGDLYYCKEDSEKESGIGCSKITLAGYYINSNSEVYTCKVEGSLGCKLKSISSNVCGADSDIGKIFIDNNDKINLCANYASSKAYPVLLSSISSNYLIQYKDGNVFGTTSQKNAIVSVGENSVTLNIENYNYTKGNYVYVNPNTYAILKENQCPSHTNSPLSSVVDEFYKCDDDNYICHDP